jgi:hypothetical protein
VPIWATVYLLAVAGVVLWSVVDDLRSRKPWWRPTADLVATMALGYLFAGYHRRELVEPLGRVAALLYTAALLWTGAAAHREATEDDPDPELSARENLVAEHLGIALGLLLVAPLLALAAAAAYQAW